MHFTDVANDLLAIADKRDRILDQGISALGEDTWHILLKLYIYRHSKLIARRTMLEGVMRFPTSLDRIISVLSNRNLVTEDSSETDGNHAYKITETAVSRIQLILDNAFGVTDTKI